VQQLPPPQRPQPTPEGLPPPPLAPLAPLLRPLLDWLIRRLASSALPLERPSSELPPLGQQGRWLRRLLQRLRRGGGDASTLTPGELLLLGGLLALALTLLGQQYPHLPGGASAPNRSLGGSLEQLDRSFRLRPGWYVSLELEPLLAAADGDDFGGGQGGEGGGPSAPANTPRSGWEAQLRQRLQDGGAPPELTTALGLLCRRGLRPHYPSEALPLETAEGYHRPPPLAPLGQGLLALLLLPLDHWALEQQTLEWRGEKRRQNPAYSRLLYLRRRLVAERWPLLPPPTAG
jgi:hypothetical protein